MGLVGQALILSQPQGTGFNVQFIGVVVGAGAVLVGQLASEALRWWLARAARKDQVVDQSTKLQRDLLIELRAASLALKEELARYSRASWPVPEDLDSALAVAGARHDAAMWSVHDHDARQACARWGRVAMNFANGDASAQQEALAWQVAMRTVGRAIQALC